MTEPRLLIVEVLAEGGELALGEGQSRHVGTVLRLEVGDSLRVFNAIDGEWRAHVSAKSKRGMSVQVEQFLRAAKPAPDLDLLFAPVKRYATDLIVEKATELGVRGIRPVITQRTIAETVRLDRLQSIAREAAEQTERFDAPEIFAPVSLPKVLDGWDRSRALIFADEAVEAVPILAAFAELSAMAPWTAGVLAGETPAVQEYGASGAVAFPPARPPSPTPPPQGGRGLSLLIGPEGGFTAEERAMLRACAFVVPVSLGPRILRAETAVIAALSIIQAAWGDWREGYMLAGAV